ncbi:hypothetical protein J6U76_07495 [bacterium]|nr:hypothetical protein [bacterium]
MPRVIYSKQNAKKSEGLSLTFKLGAFFCALLILVVVFCFGLINMSKKKVDVQFRIANLEYEIVSLKRDRDFTKSELEKVRAVEYVEKALQEAGIHLRKTKLSRIVNLQKPSGIDQEKNEEQTLASGEAVSESAKR